jgi:hypothetical protein
MSKSDVAKTLRACRATAIAVWAFLAAPSCSAPVEPAPESSEQEAVVPATNDCELGQECCPPGYVSVTLTSKADVYSAPGPKRCIWGLGGSDAIVANLGTSVVLAGDGDDTIMAGPTSVVRGGPGNDTINAWSGPSLVYGGPGDDTIMAADGNNLVVPGPGRDTVYCGTGNDTVALYDLCEINGGGKTLDGGGGKNTLITPVPVTTLKARGVTVKNFQTILVQQNSCKSECATKVDCSGNGTCIEGASTGQMSCACNPGFFGAHCEVRCPSPLDSDQDGTLDCVDECPHDAKKTARGVCGCGVEETDSDRDGTPDCNDPCPGDKNNVWPGECGCVGESDVKDPGYPCSDAACPGQEHATCNGQGTCGNPDACKPDASCKLLHTEGSSYWICGNGSGARSSAGAADACGAKGLALARIDTYKERQRIQAALSGPSWIAAPTDTAPGKCMVMQATDGRSIDENCGKSLPYVCEYSAPERYMTLPTVPIAHQPPAATTACVDEVPNELGMMPSTLLSLLNQSDQANSGGDLGNAAGDAPAPGTFVQCPTDPFAEGTNFVGDLRILDCLSDEECKVLGADHVCREVKVDPACVPSQTQKCTTRYLCGVVQGLANDTPDTCQQVELCTTGTDFVATPPSDTVDFPPETLSPETIFANGAPSVEEDGEFRDPPGADGKGWCALKSQDPDKVKDAVAPDHHPSGTTGGDSGKIKFDFNPDVVFEVRANPLSFGENAMKVRAGASVTAHVNVKLFSEEFDGDILKANVALAAERCGVRTNETVFELFGEDIIDAFLDPKYRFDTTEDGAGLACKTTLAKFQLSADRLKKAFRDAQQLVKQYRALSSGTHFGADLCEALLVTTSLIPNFPGGNVCPVGEPPELTINRFIEYYQGSGSGSQLSAMNGVAAELADVTGSVRKLLSGKIGGMNRRIPLIDKQRTEGWNILTANFMIGPIPMVMQIDAVTSYGARGALDIDVQFPTDLGSKHSSTSSSSGTFSEEIAHVNLGVEPYAAAGLSFFAGVGFDYGVASVRAGIEGAMSLARMSAPIHAGAGLGVATTPDQRTDADIEPYSLKSAAKSVLAFGSAANYQFYANYEYGLDFQLQDVLSGEINAKARAKFAFFSRTWRKRLLKFTGWNHTYHLLAGSGGIPLLNIPGGGSRTPTAEGSLPMGVQQSQVPLVMLQPLDPPLTPPVPDPNAEVPFKMIAVKSMFYDDLCCSKPQDACGQPGQAGCCPGLQCQMSPDKDKKLVGACCAEYQSSCTSNDDCCSKRCDQGACDLGDT